MSDDKTSLPMLLPGFVCLCTAVIFGPVSEPPVAAIIDPDSASTDLPMAFSALRCYCIVSRRRKQRRGELQTDNEPMGKLVF